MSNENADYYAALNAVLGAIHATHEEDRERVQALLEGLDLNLFIMASLGISELLVSEFAERLRVPFDLLMGDLRGKVLDMEHGSGGAA